MLHHNNPVIKSMQETMLTLVGDIRYDVTLGGEKVGTVFAKSDAAALHLAVLSYGLSCDVVLYNETILD